MFASRCPLDRDVVSQVTFFVISTNVVEGKCM